VSLPPGATGAQRVGGGDINEAWRVTLADGATAFVKTRADAGPGEYAAEAEGLAWLAEPGALRTPRVIEVGKDYLALEWIDPGHLDAAGTEELGRGLAATHAAGAARFGDPRRGDSGGMSSSDSPLEGAGEGGSGDPRLGGSDAAGPNDPSRGDSGPAAPSQFGSLRLPNEPTADWPAFYAERRLRPLAAIARARGTLPEAGVRAVERVCERIAALAGPPEQPARLHGDLWGGNVMADAQGKPWLIDPSAYGGHREVDLAMLRLFGAPSERVFAAYAEVAPLSDGWEDRIQLWQLSPLLVHAVLFGGSYPAAAERIALRYAG
jgi:fructosamine-3-kinase